MGSLYYPWADIASDAGLRVMVTDTNAGWETRSRSSGGFGVVPLGVMWHHAASSNSMSDEACVDYQVRGNPDNPVGNMTLGRNGDVWPIAGGASNCSGKGGPWGFSRGTCPKDSGNTYLANVEVNNDGVGGPWAVELVDAYFALSNAVNAFLNNQPNDVVGHHHYTPDRKIDPATAWAVEGPWQPESLNSSGTWSLDDMRFECAARASAGPGPTPRPPTPQEDDEVFVQYARSINPELGPGEVFAIYSNGTKIWQINDGTLEAAQALTRLGGADDTIYDYPDMTQFGALGMVPQGMNAPGHDAWGNKVSR